MKLQEINSAANVTKLLADQKYVSSTEISTIVYLSLKLRRPILVEGPAGVGKTELAKATAKALNLELLKLQCYEGLDETKAIYEWEYAKQLLYTQMLKEKINEVIGDAEDISQSVDKLIHMEDAFFSEHFLLPRPLLKSIVSEDQKVLLIDEIDKSDPEFEAYLLEILSTYEITIPELGTMKAKVPPIVFLTSNNSRDLSDALKRRCLHLYIDFPTAELETQIVRNKFPDMGQGLVDRLVNTVQQIRDLDVKKKPSISETLDWAESLVTLQIEDLNADVLKTTLGMISKYKSDADQILEKAAKLLEA